MAENSPIEWTDHTWSPWEGCTKVGPGCDNCYAAGMNRWLRAGTNWGPGAPRREYSDEHWLKPLRWNAAAAKKGMHAKVFPSVCDPFDNEVSNTRRAKFIGLMWDTPHLTWLLLTKRIGNVPAMIEECTEPGKDWRDTLPPNAWIGATIVNREELLRDGPKLRALPRRVLFWSVEPMLGDLGAIPHDLMPHWVIAGGESGRAARPAHPDWFRSLRDQCAAADVPFLFKQWGACVPATANGDGSFEVDDGCGLDQEHGPDRLRIGWVPEHDGKYGWYFARVDKKAAGRLLDGVEHNGFPEVA
jgi:protein gp37